MQLRLVLVEPEGRINFGYILRLCRNFSIGDICVVRPKFDLRDPEVLSFAAGGASLVDSVRVSESLEECLKDVDYSVCTTSVAGASDDYLRQAVSPWALPLLIPRRSKVALVFGRESVGLTRAELASCDLISTLVTPSDYNVLNLSHAVAVYLYELVRVGTTEVVVGERCSSDYVKVLMKYAENLGAALNLSQDEVSAVKHSIAKAMLTKPECRALYKLLKGALALIRKSL